MYGVHAMTQNELAVSDDPDGFSSSNGNGAGFSSGAPGLRMVKREKTSKGAISDFTNIDNENEIGSKKGDVSGRCSRKNVLDDCSIPSAFYIET